jgi:hypothetical protein
MDLPWLIQGHLSHMLSFMFFQANVSRYFNQMFQVKRDGHMLLDTIQKEGLQSIM